MNDTVDSQQDVALLNENQNEIEEWKRIAVGIWKMIVFPGLVTYLLLLTIKTNIFVGGALVVILVLIGIFHVWMGRLNGKILFLVCCALLIVVAIFCVVFVICLPPSDFTDETNNIDRRIQSSLNSSNILVNNSSEDGGVEQFELGGAKIQRTWNDKPDDGSILTITVSSKTKDNSGESPSAQLKILLENIGTNILDAEATIAGSSQQLVVTREGADYKGFSPLPWFKVVTDEEAIAFWFLEKVAANSEKLNFTLSEDDKSKLLQFLSLLIRFRLAGVDKGLSIDSDDHDSLVPSSMSRRFRWKMWWNGSERIASIIQFAIYYLAVLGICTAFYRMDIVKQLTNEPDNIKAKRMQADHLALAAFVDFALPALGFFGTIYGLGSAFGAVGIISHIELTKEISLVEVLLNLATAFSTTFFALGGSIFVALIGSFATAAENKFDKNQTDKQNDEVLRLLDKNNLQ